MIAITRICEPLTDAANDELTAHWNVFFHDSDTIYVLYDVKDVSYEYMMSALENKNGTIIPIEVCRNLLYFYNTKEGQIKSCNAKKYIDQYLTGENRLLKINTRSKNAIHINFIHPDIDWFSDKEEYMEDRITILRKYEKHESEASKILNLFDVLKKHMEVLSVKTDHHGVTKFRFLDGKECIKYLPEYHPFDQ